MSKLPERIQTEDPSFVRDMHSKALLNTDRNALERHRRNVAKNRTKTSEMAELRARVNGLEEKLDLILDLLKR
jgi:hypothetical protein